MTLNLRMTSPSTVKQAEIDTVHNWCDEFCMHLPLEKCVVRHTGSLQKQYIYTVHDKIIHNDDSLKDLGAMWLWDGSYTEHSEMVLKKTAKNGGSNKTHTLL